MLKFFCLLCISCKYGATCRYNHPDRNCTWIIQINSINVVLYYFPPLSLSSFMLIFAAINPAAAAAIGHPLITSPAASLNIGVVNPAASIYQTIDPRLAQPTVSDIFLFCWFCFKRTHF